MNTKSQNCEIALQAYERRMTEVFEKIETIKAHLQSEGQDGTKINWGHVGSAGHINELLDNIMFFIGAKEEE